MSSIEAYTKKVRTELKARPILPFGAPLEIGAIGVLQDDQFVPRGNVRSTLGLTVNPSKVAIGTRASWQLSSGRDVKVSFLADGTASQLFPTAPSAQAKIELSFSNKDSFFVSATSLKISTLTDPASLIQGLLDAYKRGVWQEEYIVVYETMTPQEVIVLLSKTKGSSFLLSAKTNVQPPQGTAEIAGKFELRFQNQDAVHFNSGGQPLFFNAYRVKKGFWGNVTVRALGPDDLAKRAFERA